MINIDKKYMKQNEGITLVALVVTIVVLIILATVSMNAVFGEHGIIKKAEEAKQLYENSAEREEQLLENMVDEYKDLVKYIESSSVQNNQQ